MVSNDCVYTGWLSVCRSTAIIALVLQLVCLVLFLILAVCVVCQLISCAVVQDELCQRVLFYATPITCIIAGMSLDYHAVFNCIVLYCIEIFKVA